MNVYLLHPNRDFDIEDAPPPRADDLRQDLEVSSVVAAMADGDPWLARVGEKVLISSTTDLDTIRYRQSVLRDCLANPQIVRQIYALAVEALETERKENLGYWRRRPSSILHGAIKVMSLMTAMMLRLRTIADQRAGAFESVGFARMLAMISAELDDAYLGAVRHELAQLEFRHGILISAQLGEGNKGDQYVLRKQHAPERDWFKRLFGPRPETYTFRIHPRDESGFRALSELSDRGLNLVANALAQASDHVVSFFAMLRTELAFYVGCLNLYDRLTARGLGVCFPTAAPQHERRHRAVELYDVALALRSPSPIVGNDLDADRKELVVVTGANEGGKSTFLRGCGLAQLMMQCGAFVAATTFEANVCARILTHYRREEDAAMESGKFDEELDRMSGIVDALVPDSLVLFNESFAATNEREGSEIADQIVSALLDGRIKVFFVTHQFEFAERMRTSDRHALFLRAERRADGGRTFRIVEGAPLDTSYGPDLYAQLFAATTDADPTAKQLPAPVHS
jgi:DNA mismatch repair ATPase MutS